VLVAHFINIAGMIAALIAIKGSRYFETVKEPLYTEEQIKMYDQKFNAIL
jgi:hypothetical protein